jgi:hypothetical protein
MRTRILAIALLASVASFVACDEATRPLRLGVGGTAPVNSDTLNVAVVRFANATVGAKDFDVLQGGVIDTGNGPLEFGMASRCITVVASSPIVEVRQTRTNISFTGFNFARQGAGRYTIIAFSDVTNATQFNTIANTVFVAMPGQTGFAVFNAISDGTAYDVYVTSPTAPLTATTPAVAGVLGGVNSGFVGVNSTTPQRIRITLADAKTVVLDLGNVTFIPAVNTVLVIASPLPRTSTIRAFLVPGC